MNGKIRMPKVEPFYIDRRFTRSPFGFIDIEDVDFPKAIGFRDRIPTPIKLGYDKARERLDALYGVEQKNDFGIECIHCHSRLEISMFSRSEFEDEAMRQGWRLSKAWVVARTVSGYKKKQGWICPSHMRSE